MPTNHTANYNLNQWVKTDQVKMEDFNADNAKIDAAIKAAQQKADSLAVSKADASALTAEINARTAAVTAETNARTAAVTAEANTRAAAVTAEANARTAAIAALNTAVSKRGNCQIQYFTYTGAFLPNNPTSSDGIKTLTFPEKPVVVILSDGCGVAFCYPGEHISRILGSSDGLFSYEWGEDGASIRLSGYHLNGKDGTYHAIAFYAKD